jgi:hypothetical protein
MHKEVSDLLKCVFGANVGQVPDLPRRRRRRTGQVGDLPHRLGRIPWHQEVRVWLKLFQNDEQSVKKLLEMAASILRGPAA